MSSTVMLVGNSAHPQTCSGAFLFTVQSPDPSKCVSPLPADSAMNGCCRGVEGRGGTEKLLLLLLLAVAGAVMGHWGNGPASRPQKWVPTPRLASPQHLQICCFLSDASTHQAGLSPRARAPRSSPEPRRTTTSLTLLHRRYLGPRPTGPLPQL